jgi:hypothetical protein
VPNSGSGRPGGGSFAAVRNAFFDQEAVLKAVDRAIARQLSRFGAFVRQRSRSSIRKRKKVSDAGKPPTDRTGPLKLIYFAYDRDSETVTIGPILFPAKGKAGADLLEYGGLRPGNGRVIFITRDPGRDKTGKFVTHGKRKVKLNGTLVYRPRPFMTPAFEAELPKFLAGFKDSITPT